MRLFAESAKCSGCHACLVACSFHLFGENTPKKAALRITGLFPDPGGYAVAVCTQCGECADVCPSDAILQNVKGAFYIEPERCDLCMACVDACPEEVVFVRGDVDYAWECDLCGDCVAVCGMDALWIGE